MGDPWQWWTPERIAAVIDCPVDNVSTHWPILAAALERRGLWDRDIARGVIATVAIETGGPDRSVRFTPVREAYWLPESWRQTNLRYYPFYGRGYPNLTWEDGYRDAGQALGRDLLNNPDLALVPTISADITAWFFATKTVPAKDGSRVWTLAQLCREGDTEWIRRAVQGGTAGLDRFRQMWRDLGDANPVEIMRENIQPLRVTEDNVRLRERPDTNSPILYEARAGESVEPVTDHAWRQVRAGGRAGWMAAEYLSEIEQTETSAGGIAVSGPKLQFAPHTPTELQQQDWTCSVRSTMWMLKSLGIQVTPEEAQDAMSPRYVRPDVGLLDASGAGIVEVLRDRWGVGAYNDGSASFDDVLAVAGRMPVALGLRNWGGPNKGHWTAVRGWDGPPGAERLLLANPGGTGAVYGQQTLNREQFDARGDASMVVIPLGA